jgi:osmotically-inducible protein OsmY
MADRYSDYERRDRDRDRDRESAQRYEDYRNAWRGESYRGGSRDYEQYGGESNYDREGSNWGDRGRYGSRGSEFGQRDREDWRDRTGETGQGLGGGMGSYTGQDWRTRRYSSYGGGMGEGFGSGRDLPDYDRGSYERGGYQTGQSGYRGSYGAEGTAGRFTGRGPKGYQRSDERIREDVCERLTQHSEIDASEIELQVNNGEITLTGSVEDRRQKRLAEDVAENVFGVRETHNQLRISKGLGQRMGEALGLTGNREEQESRPSGTITGRQNEPVTTRR